MGHALRELAGVELAYAEASVIEVVAAAIVRGGTVLAARRSRPAELAGRWEFPGGKLELNEDPRDALVREIGEELGVAVRVGTVIGEASDGRIRLVLHLARLDGGEPEAHDEHDALRWLTPEEFGEVTWLPIDRDLLVHLPAHLLATGKSAQPAPDER